MQPHQQRVVDEKTALDEKNDKLKAFIMGSVFSTLPYEERSRLDHQYDVMMEYSRILRDRIAAFTPKVQAQ